MTNFTIRTVRYAHQTSDVACFEARDSLFVELLILGNPKFKQTIRGRKFLFGNGKNAFDDCIVYLGRLHSGKWITDEDYQVATGIAYRAWESYNASETRDMVPSNSIPPLDRIQGVDYATVGVCVENGIRYAIRHAVALCEFIGRDEEGVSLFMNVDENLIHDDALSSNLDRVLKVAKALTGFYIGQGTSCKEKGEDTPVGFDSWGYDLTPDSLKRILG